MRLHFPWKEIEKALYELETGKTLRKSDFTPNEKGLWLVGDQDVYIMPNTTDDNITTEIRSRSWFMPRNAILKSWILKSGIEINKPHLVGMMASSLSKLKQLSGKVSVPGEVLAYQAVSIFVESALPEGIGERNKKSH